MPKLYYRFQKKRPTEKEDNQSLVERICQLKERFQKRICQLKDTVPKMYYRFLNYSEEGDNHTEERICQLKDKVPKMYYRFQKKRPNQEGDSNSEEGDNQSLVTEERICQLNDTVPNLQDIIQKVSYQYGIKKLLENLNSVFDENENLIEENIEKKLKEKNLIPRTRKAFWEKLKNELVLIAVKGGWCSSMKCVIMLESECDVEPPNNQKLERDKRIDAAFGLDSFDHKNNCLNVLYNPIYDSKSDLLKQKKIMFDKQYVIRKLGEEEYRRRKEKFESNQIAELNLTKLKSVSLKCGPLGIDDLDTIDINCEQRGVWNALVDQHIIDSNGKLLSNFQKFSYPECPAYEEHVMRLIDKIFGAEIVKLQWLRAVQDPNCSKAINLLPLKPYRDMLGDLMAAHVICSKIKKKRGTQVEN